MKILSKTAIVVFFLLVISAYSQQGSTIDYKSGSGIFIGSGAVIYTNQIILNGSQSGTGRFCTGSYHETAKLITAVIQNNNVILSWRYEAELYNTGFELERKTDGNDWVNLAYIKGSGSFNKPGEYTYEDSKLLPGKYFYRLKQIDNEGNYEYFDLSQNIIISKPNEYSIGQNYPNPSNPKSNIDFQLPERTFVNISVYNLLGQLVTTLVNQEKDAGLYTVTFDGTDLSSGTYIYKITAGTFTEVKKMLLVK